MMTSKLMKYGLTISVVCLGGCILMEKQMQKRFRNQAYYQDAVVLLQKYEPAGEILGRPVLSGKLNLGSTEECSISPVSAKISISLKGSKQDGILHVLASKLSQKEEDKWTIDQLDLEVKLSKQRWKFYEGRRATNGTTTQVESSNVSASSASTSSA